MSEEQGFFVISRLHRDDLANAGFSSEDVSDGDMETIAKKLHEDYMEQLYWDSLKIIADYVGLKRNITLQQFNSTLLQGLNLPFNLHEIRDMDANVGTVFITLKDGRNYTISVNEAEPEPADNEPEV